MTRRRDAVKEKLESASLSLMVDNQPGRMATPRDDGRSRLREPLEAAQLRADGHLGSPASSDRDSSVEPSLSSPVTEECAPAYPHADAGIGRVDSAGSDSAGWSLKTQLLLGLEDVEAALLGLALRERDASQAAAQEWAARQRAQRDRDRLQVRVQYLEQRQAFLESLLQVHGLAEEYALYPSSEDPGPALPEHWAPTSLVPSISVEDMDEAFNSIQGLKRMVKKSVDLAFRAEVATPPGGDLIPRGLKEGSSRSKDSHGHNQSLAQRGMRAAVSFVKGGSPLPSLSRRSSTTSVVPTSSTSNNYQKGGAQGLVPGTPTRTNSKSSGIGDDSRLPPWRPAGKATSSSRVPLSSKKWNMG